ncbi:DNA repair protein RAD51-like 3 [Corchorus olitorius]|uniref:DNA repair protein RAD51-like 3 n=1 Tax=Corchorus olitorius TaxID=93759 RepID=A0A1R3K0J9_9ROSI|nr:DNA repair protein RAD51-like 3 [Corchorus olitorius]
MASRTRVLSEMASKLTNLARTFSLAALLAIHYSQMLPLAF